MANLIGCVVITTEEYKKLIEESIVLNAVKKYAAEEDFIFDSEIRKIIGVPKPEKKEGEE